MAPAATPIRYTRPAAPAQRLTALSREQEAAVTRWRDEWLRIGMDTTPADRPRAEAAIRAMCARIGVECPPIVWCDGPLTLCLTHLLLRRLHRASASLGASLRASLDASLDDSLRASLRASLDASLDDSLRASLDDSLRASLDDSLDDSLRASLDDSLDASLGASLDDSLDDSLDASLDASLRASLRASLDDSLRASLDDSLDASLDASLDDSLRASLGASLDDSLDDSLRASLDASLDDSLRASLDSADWSAVEEVLWWWSWYMGGQHSLAWWAHYAYCRDELGVNVGEDQSADLDLWLEVSRSCGWWRPRNGLIYVCERPAVQLLDEDGRLHCDDGPAIVCRDAYAVWAIHGVRCSRQVVESPETLTVDQIRSESNAEIRRIMVDRFGAERYLRESNAELLDDDVEWGKLWRVELPEDEDLVMVEVINSSPEPDGSFKTYWLRVPPESRSARGAIAWTFDVPENQYTLVTES